MLHKEDCYCATCDNCGEVFSDWHDFSLFPLEDDVKDRMRNDSDWYTGGDPNHEGKHYCPECFERDEEIDDKIIVDETRKKAIQYNDFSDKMDELGERTDKRNKLFDRLENLSIGLLIGIAIGYVLFT